MKRVIMFIIMFSALSFVLCGCNNKNTSDSTDLEKKTVTYTIKHYFETVEGEFVEDRAAAEQKSAEEGENVKASSILREGFTFDEDNTLNKTQTILTKEGNNELALYYTRNSYKLTVIGGKAHKTQVLYGEQVSITPDIPGSNVIFNVVGEGAKIEDGVLTVGNGNVTVTIGYENLIMLNETEYVDYKRSSFSVNVNVDDVTQKHGIVFLYSNIFGNEKYYSFVSQENKLRLYLYEGTKETLLKTKLNVNVTEGAHTYSVALSADGKITCSFDGEVMITRDISGLANAINNPGQFGAYDEGKNVSVNEMLVEYGKAKLNNVKQFLVDTLSYVTVKTYKFDLSTWTVVNSVEKINAAKSVYFEIAHKLINDIDKCTDAKTLISLVSAIDDQYEINLVKEGLSESLHMLAQDLVDCLLRPYVGNAEDVVNTQSSNAVISMDIYHKDARAYVPGAYKLYSGTAGDEKGIFDFFREELAVLNTVEEITALGDKYYFDIARNTISKISEFYYVWNYENGFPAYDVFWHIYTYTNANHTFKYVGCVDSYVYPNAGYFRLPGIYYNQAECVTDTTNLLVMHKWMRENQIKAPGSYNVTFNLNGGLLDGATEVVVDATQDYILPTPKKDGATFGGWFTSRNFRNGAITKIAAMNRADCTLYAKWKEEVKPSITVADIFTENMVLPRNKAVKVHGIGKDGVAVSVTFGGQELSTTVVDGVWSVTLEPMAVTSVGKTLTVSADDVTYTFKNVVVGEVWLCSGQSNMEFRVTWLNLKQIGAYGELDYSKIRIYRQSVPNATDTYDTNSDRWFAFNNQTKAFDVLNFSAIALGFAAELQNLLGEDIIIGVVESSRGGTFIEEWMSADDISATGSTVPATNKSIESRYYNGMTKLLSGFPFSGVVWYQGCSNADYPELYVEQFKALVAEWREMFGNQNLPIMVAQLVQYGGLDFRDFRLMQWELMKEMPNVYTISGIDLGLEQDIHPHDKLPLAKRLAAVAANYVYNAIEGSVLSAYPVSIEKADEKLVISFADAQDGFVADYVINGFEVAGADGKFVACEAEVVDGKIVLSGFDFDVVSVRYLYYKYFGEVDLYTANGLPVAPFVWIIE